MRFLLFVFLSMQMFSTPAFALSCAEPVMNAQAVANAQAIFEGTVVEADENAFPSDSVRKDAMGKSGLYTFRVTKAWKGVQEGDMVKIRRNTYWGDGFVKDADYLIVAETQTDGVLVAGLCGLSMPLNHAAKSLEYLKAHPPQ